MFVYKQLQRNLHQSHEVRFLLKISLSGLLGLLLLLTMVGVPVPRAKAHQNQAATMAIINLVFGPDGPAANRVAQCESGLNPGAYNPTPVGGSHAEGLFQLLVPTTWSTTSQGGQSPYDARANTLAAHEIFVRDGHSWREWTCQP